MLISLCLKAYLSEMSNLLFFYDKKYIFNFAMKQTISAGASSLWIEVKFTNST